MTILGSPVVDVMMVLMQMLSMALLWVAIIKPNWLYLKASMASIDVGLFWGIEQVCNVYQIIFTNFLKSSPRHSRTQRKTNMKFMGFGNLRITKIQRSLAFLQLH